MEKDIIMSKEMRKQMDRYNKLLIESELNEGLKSKIAGALMGLSMMVASCDSITPEEKQRLQTEIESLAKKEEQDKKMVNYYDSQVEDKKSKVQSLDDEVKHLETKLGILKKGKTPRYILKLRFQELQIELDRISFTFEIPVDEQFYKESEIGKELGKGSRAFSFHSGDIKIVDKRIE